MTDLLPCPWCGSVEHLEMARTGIFWVVCKNDLHGRLDGPPGKTAKAATLAWNRRIPDASLAADLEEAADCIDEHVGNIPVNERNKGWIREAFDLAARLRGHSKRIGWNTK